MCHAKRYSLVVLPIEFPETVVDLLLPMRDDVKGEKLKLLQNPRNRYQQANSAQFHTGFVRRGTDEAKKAQWLHYYAKDLSADQYDLAELGLRDFSDTNQITRSEPHGNLKGYFWNLKATPWQNSANTKGFKKTAVSMFRVCARDHRGDCTSVTPSATGLWDGGQGLLFAGITEKELTKVAKNGATISQKAYGVICQDIPECGALPEPQGGASAKPTYDCPAQFNFTASGSLSTESLVGTKCKWTCPGWNKAGEAVCRYANNQTGPNGEVVAYRWKFTNTSDPLRPDDCVPDEKMWKIGRSGSPMYWEITSSSTHLHS